MYDMMYAFTLMDIDGVDRWIDEWICVNKKKKEVSETLWVKDCQ